jgi:hypothetical protein
MGCVHQLGAGAVLPLLALALPDLDRLNATERYAVPKGREGEGAHCRSGSRLFLA